MRFVTTEAAMPNSRAALARLPASATATNVLRFSMPSKILSASYGTVSFPCPMAARGRTEPSGRRPTTRTCGAPARLSGTVAFIQTIGTANRWSTRTSVPARSAVATA